MTSAPDLTNRDTLARNRARAARKPALFLHQAVADEIHERLSEVNKLFTAPALVGHLTPPFTELFPDSSVHADTPHLSLPGGHDLILHLFGLHWADDPMGQMVQCRIAMQPDGLFLGVMFGGATLNELRSSLAEAETQLTGGLSPRVLPMGDLRDLGGLIQRAGLALPVADSQRLTVRYKSLAALAQDLRGMGETNALAQRNKNIPPKHLFELAENLYTKHFSDEDGYLLATFEVIYLTGWAPSASQQQPLRPGSAQSRLADALGVPELKSGDPAKPDKS